MLRLISSYAMQAVASIATLGCGLAAFVLLSAARPEPGQSESPSKIEHVEVATVEQHVGEVELSVDGVVVPFRDVQMAAEVSGRVTYKSENCRAGRSVREGDLLIKIDPRDFQNAVQNLEEELAQAENVLLELDIQIESAASQIELAKEDLTLQNRYLERTQSLSSRGVSTQSDLDEATRAVLAARTTLQTQLDQKRLHEASRRRLQSVCQRIKVQLEQARVDLERTEIRAPMDGVISEAAVESQSYVQNGTLLFVLRDVSQLDVRCSLQADQMYWLWKEQPVSAGSSGYEFPETQVLVQYEIAGKHYAWDGVLSRYDGAGVDSRTRMIPCRVHVDRPREVRQLDSQGSEMAVRPPTLMVGMFVQLKILVPARQRLLRIPAQALQPGNRVWVVEVGRLSQHQVRIANTASESILVYEDGDGVTAGTAVVVSPLVSPQAGEAVHVRGET